MATFNKFNAFVEALAEGAHNLESDTLKVLLTNTAPVAANSVRANLTEIAAGTYTLVADDEVITASGGTIGPFRYVVLYNDTAANDELIGWYDYGSSVTLNDGETFTIDFGGSVLSIT